MRLQRWKDILPTNEAVWMASEERKRSILRAFQAGATGPEIARSLKISRTRVYQLKREAERLFALWEKHPEWLRPIGCSLEWKRDLRVFLRDREEKARRTQECAAWEERGRLPVYHF